jgi:hypothetical protein
MSSVVINVSDLRGYKGDFVRALEDFLKSQFDVVVSSKKNEITLEFDEEKEIPSRSQLRLVLRKFLHREYLKEDMRVISGGENAFIIKDRKERP